MTVSVGQLELRVYLKFWGKNKWPLQYSLFGKMKL
jgi:hypothetical protein